MREEGQGTPTDNPEPPSIWKQMRSAVSPVEKEEPEFKANLGIEGIAPDVIPKDEERIGQIQNVVDKLRTGYHTQSIIEDLVKTGKSVKFSEESSRTVHELGNIESHELEQISRTIQCQSCLKHVLEGLNFCSCGICVRPDEEQIQRITTRFEVMMVPYHHARANYSRGTRREAQLQKDHWKARGARRGARKNNHDSIVLRWQNDEKYQESWKVHGWAEDYCRYLDNLTTVGISYSAPWHQRNGYENTILVVSNDDANSYSSSTRTRTTERKNSEERKSAKDHPMKHCEQTWNGTVKIRDPTGRKLLLHHLRKNGGDTNTKTLNGKINISGKSDGHRLFQSHVDLFSQISRTDISECRARDGR